MVTKEQIQRINELYKKQCEQGLTEEEKKEQDILRKLYISSMKENLRAQLKNIKIVTPEEYEKLKGRESCGCHDDNCSCHDDNCSCHDNKHDDNCNCDSKHYKH